MNSRREFIKGLSYGAALVVGGSFQSLSASEIFHSRSKVKLRFLVASDSHYGQANTAYDAMLDEFLKEANQFHISNPLDFCVINGDIIHDEPKFMPEAKLKYDQLNIPYFVTKGNHDKISDDEWNSIWEMPVNHQVEIDKNGIILVTTSNVNGDYLSPNLEYLRTQLDASTKLKNVFLFVHIPQTKRTNNGIETPAFFELLENYPNVKAVFHGHEHDQDGITFKSDIPFIFDAHIGGSWGTKYRGFRVVELMKDNSIVTYMMNPREEILRETIVNE
jgi:DNA repair exonuclease SbcCD nuclease subunit